MADYNSTATITLQANGQSAANTLNDLQKRAHDLENAFARAAAAGNKTDLKKIQKELTATRRQIKDMTSSVAQAEQVLRRLDKATPKELRQTLTTLTKQLNTMERGSKAWEQQSEKIRLVREELHKVNSELSAVSNNKKSFTDIVKEWQVGIMGVVMAINNAINGIKRFVDIYANLQSEMANVSKYTGLNGEQVEKLNDEFKKIDTRTSIEGLNQLAQEAGRLGKTSQEDILGFVRAADQINVALDDLGEGATLTLSKLTDIFGVEKEMGTEKSLLAVGSVINELSQSSSASASYLAEFAKRMAGVGAQAGMTVQEIMSFAAVLDSQGQNVELSSTALNKLVMKLFSDTKRVAQATGLDLEQFNATIKRSTSEGLVMLLERLKELGGMDALAPLFKEMGTDGAGATAVISTLAKEVETVKTRMGEANKAFSEATSVGKEAAIQNSTVAASLDKEQKALDALSAELGKQLLPIQIAATKSTVAFMQAITFLFSWVKSNIGYILTLTAAITAYKIAVNLATIQLKLHSVWIAITSKGMALLEGTTILLKAAFYALTGQLGKARAAMLAFNMLTKTNPMGLLAAAITAVVGVLTTLIIKNNEAIDSQKRMKNTIAELQKTAAEASAKEISQLQILYQAATNEAKSKNERIKAAEMLQKKYPAYFGSLSTESILVGKAAKQYNNLTKSILANAEARAAAKKIEENAGKIIELRRQLAKQEAESNRLAQNVNKPQQQTAATAIPGMQVGRNLQNENISIYNAAERRRTTTKAKLGGLIKENTELANMYNLEQLINEDNVPNISYTNPDFGSPSGNTPSSTATTDKFAKEEAARQAAEAQARIDYARGKTTYQEYTDELLSIQDEYLSAKLKHTDLSEAERLDITAEYEENLLKIQGAQNAKNVDDENKRYEDELILLKQRFINGESTRQQYDDAAELAELEHWRQMTIITADGSKEQADANKHYLDLQFKNAENNRRKTEELEKKHQEELERIKNEVFSNTPTQNTANYNRELANLETVKQQMLAIDTNTAADRLAIEEAFQKAKLQLQKKYGQITQDEAEEEAANFFETKLGKAISGSVSTLNSGMSAMFQQLSSIVQAELEIQTAAIDKRYDDEISKAEGNNYKIKKLEQQKQKEIAKAKNEANKKMFAMQVIQAVAQTAQNAIAAYGSALAIPIVGNILAPIAAAMAVAAGMMQVSAIKKQQQAAESQGYSQGGFTRPGAVDEPAGIVHAGEWVASQKLVNSPQTRPLINALEYAQRTNTIGSISGSNNAQNVIPQITITPATPNLTMPKELSDTLSKLNNRLNEPFVTVNTVTGDMGIEQAQQEYQRLMRNKAPKNKR